VGRYASHLEPFAVRALLDRLSPVKDEIVLIGGQALNFWAERYEQTSELFAASPYTSKDIDFYGGAAQVERCASLLGATHRVYTPSDATASAGYVTTTEGVQIDFVHSPKGLKPSEIMRRSVSFPSVRVMHPIHVMISRAANVVHIPRTDTHSLDQLRAARYVVREFIRRDVLQRGAIKFARKLNEEAFDVVISDDGLTVWGQYAIDLFEAVLPDAELGERFTTIRYPQMRIRLTSLRASARV
jgi:hypothetical protein